MWRNQLHSSQFLAGPIHDKVYQKYYRSIFTKAQEESIQRAKRLQQFLYALKNFEKNLLAGEKNIFTIQEYFAFKQAYGEVLDAKGEKLNALFRSSGGANFEQELGHAQLALKKIFENPSFLFEKEEKQKEFLGKIVIGQDSTKINFPTGEIVNGTIQKILEGVGTQSTKWASQEAKKAFYKAKKAGVKNPAKDILYVINDVQPKIDLSTDSITVSFSQAIEYPLLAEFAILFSKARISAKNYSANEVAKSGVSVGEDTNLFRIMTDFIPTLNVIESQDQEVSFQYAIFKRHLNLANEKIDEDKNIEQHFSHIQTVYELMGVGQNYYNKNGTIKELNNFLKQGVEFLIINEHNSDNIIVKSTRQILAQFYKRDFANGRVKSLRKKIRVTKKLL